MDRGVMIFVSPETVVESIRPRVRVIQADGIKNFARELSIAKAIFSDMDFRTAINLLTNPRLPEKTKKKKASLPPIDVTPVIPEALAKVDKEIVKVARKVNFSRREWVIIAGLIALVIVVLIGLIVLVISTL